jgi:hypothetical protein
VLCVGNSRIPLRINTLLGYNDRLGPEGGSRQRRSIYNSTEKGDTEGLMMGQLTDMHGSFIIGQPIQIHF